MRVIRSRSTDLKVIPNQNWGSYSSGSISQHFVNCTGRTVYVMNRQGIVMRVHPTSLPTGYKAVELGNFNIGVRYEIPRASVELVAASGIYYSEHAQFGDQTHEEPRHWFVVNGEDISKAKVIHDPNLDLFISLYPDVLRDMALMVQKSEKPMTADKSPHSGLNLTVAIVDNRDSAPSHYYINVFDRVYKVPVSKRRDIDDGVWIDSNLFEIEGDRVGYQTIEDSLYRPKRNTVPAITIFTNADEAQVRGSVDSELKEQQRLFEEQSKIKEMELAKAKNDLEAKKMEFLKTKTLLEQENQLLKDRLEQRQMYRKEDYEERSSRRKDDSEKLSIVTKTIAAVVGLVTAVIGFLKLIY